MLTPLNRSYRSTRTMERLEGDESPVQFKATYIRGTRLSARAGPRLDGDATGLTTCCLVVCSLNPVPTSDDLDCTSQRKSIDQVTQLGTGTDVEALRCWRCHGNSGGGGFFPNHGDHGPSTQILCSVELIIKRYARVRGVKTTSEMAAVSKHILVTEVVPDQLALLASLCKLTIAIRNTSMITLKKFAC